ncbi:uncharacterized protein LOC141705173 [Apium graveolens]|uniref:uncharacterized protein LOC141704807 n=1 Tax=Apium graveolens TaxID=4045 RepID=UPI003D7C0F21
MGYVRETIPRPQGEKRKLFSKYQEGHRKNVEMTFGVLQSQFAIVHDPTQFWDKEDLAKIMRACIILHNMIVEDERDTYATPFGALPSYDDATYDLTPPNLGEESLASNEMYIGRTIQLCNRQKHRQLQFDLPYTRDLEAELHVIKEENARLQHASQLFEEAVAGHLNP